MYVCTDWASSGDESMIVIFVMPAAKPPDARANPRQQLDGGGAREGTCRDACKDAGRLWAGNPRYTPGHGVGKLGGPP